MIPETWQVARDWLTYREWRRLYERQRWRQVEQAANAFDHERYRAASQLKLPVQKTLLFMAEWADPSGWNRISKIRIAQALGVSERTVTRHWNAARAAGFLRSHDYPVAQRRTSDHWLALPDLAGATGPDWTGYAAAFIPSPGQPPF
ncbi:helix-turn-helix domain-containing protein [Arthrobacter sp. I2-34]|uniref:Helix-turn-helix domain-containing protein n=1 Tax=Arthrobacter hankyongi TaxID=2904801 RepID=A0ABS9LDB9_9MICC|nr:helix-turn-helix domain-containing protein [Arthrobacter hankyongi]MCG2624699.1 helix-turn-helix domain-containing protein [Arthrobacter hankyongi]